MNQNYFLKGEKIFLRPIEVEEILEIAKLFVKWFNDEIVTYFMFTGQKPQNTEQIVEQLKKELKEENNAVFLVVDLETKKPIGYAGLYEINSTTKKAEFRVLIGDKDFWSRGYGTEIIELIKYYGFDRLNLNRIYLGYTANNKSASKAYQKAGYVFEGILKEDIYRNSQYYDSIRMAILRKNYYEKFYKSHSERFKQEFPKK